MEVLFIFSPEQANQQESRIPEFQLRPGPFAPDRFIELIVDKMLHPGMEKRKHPEFKITKLSLHV